MVWRGLRGLGVAEATIEDAVQDVFLVVHRRLSDFEARSTFKTWLFGIVLGVARNHRRQARRKGGLEPVDAAKDIVDVGRTVYSRLRAARRAFETIVARDPGGRP